MNAPLDPYRDWLGIEQKQRPLTLYQLLRLDPGESRTERIEQAADGQIAAIQKFLSGPNARLARRTLFQLESAKQCLLDPAKKRSYDDASRTGIVAQPITIPASPGALSDPREFLPPAIGKAIVDAPALDELALSSVASLLDEALPLAEEPPSQAATLAALGILPKPPTPARRDASRKVAIIVLAAAIPISIAMGLLWLAIRWFDGPSVATAPRQIQSEANLASATAPARVESLATQNASQSSSPQDVSAVSLPSAYPSATAQTNSNSPGSESLPQRTSSQVSASRNGDGVFGSSTPQFRSPNLLPSSPAAAVAATSQRHGSLLGPSDLPASSQNVEKSPRSLSPWVVDLDKEVASFPIEDGNVPKTAATVLEILALQGFPTEPDMMPGPFTEGSKTLRLTLLAADPRVEIRLQISGEPGKRTLSIRPVIVDGGAEGPAMPFTNDRINTMAAKLPGEFEAEQQKLDAVSADCTSLEQEINRLSNIPLNNVTEVANRDYAVRTALEKLRRLTVERTNLDHAVERMQRRVGQLPALVALKEKIDRAATIRFRVFVDVEDHQVELLGRSPAPDR